MKEFERWWENNNEFCHNKSGQFSKEDAEDAWKAALERMKEKLKHEICPGDIEYFIDRELETDE